MKNCVKVLIVSSVLMTNLFSSENVPTKEEVSKLYVATFNRAPDSAGLDYWTNSSGLKLSEIAKSFFTQYETQEKYPSSTSNRNFLATVYQNMFNRQPDFGGWDYWENELNNDIITKDAFIQAAIDGAKDTESAKDLAILNNKAEVGIYFASLGLNDMSDAKVILEGITDDKATVDFAKEILDKNQVVENLWEEYDDDKTPPDLPTVTYSSNLTDDGKIALKIFGEKNSKVYIDDVYAGDIGTNFLDVLLENPNKNYNETFNIQLEDLAGNKSDSYPFITTFNRIALDDNTTYYVPKDARVLKEPENGEEAIIMSYDTNEVLSGAVAKIKLDEGSDLSLKLQEIINNINSSEKVSRSSKITQEIQNDDIKNNLLAEYTLNTSNNIGTVDLIGDLVNQILEGGISNIPTSSDSATTDSYFNLKLNLEENLNDKNTYITLSLVPNSESLNYQSDIENINNINNISNSSDTLSQINETMQISNDTNSTDAEFLFVIDDSGSMDSYQNAVSQAANDFANAITNAGINYKIAILTTSTNVDDSLCSQSSSYYYNYDANRVLCDIGIIENDIDLFKEKIINGTNGSATETAIYNAEKALQSTALGDETDGILTKLGMPSSTSSKLSIIILSDEESQYGRRADGKTFDIDNNLFVDRGYTVYSIIKPDSELSNYYETVDSQYDNLASKTGGLVANIGNTSNYSTIMNSIAQKASGSTGLKLSKVPNGALYVKKNGIEIPNDDTNGWKYNNTYNSILFYGDNIVKKDDNITVTYSY